MSVDAFILFFAAVTNLMLGLFVLLRNPKSKSSVIFFLSIVSIIIWSISNYYTENAVSLNSNIFFNRVAYFSAFCVFFCLSWFSYYFPVTHTISRKTSLALTVFFIIGSLFSVTELAAGYVYRADGGLIFESGPLGLLYAVLLLGMLSVIIYNFTRAYKGSAKKVKSQIKLLLFGFIATAVLATATNVVIPALASSWYFAKFGPLLTVFLVGSTAYAIVKHGLFDVRLFVARSIGYLLSILTLGILYGLVTFLLIGRILFPDSPLSIEQELVFIAFTVGVALTFQSVKKFFNKVSNQIFYKDAYDPQVMLDEFNRLLVSTIDLDHLLSNSSEIVQKYIKAEFVAFAFNETKEKKGRVFGGKKVAKGLISALFTKKLQVLQNDVIVSDELINTDKDLSEVLGSKDIALLARLTVDSNADRPYGYLVLGPKKSGNPYTSEDIRLIEIIANQLSIAIQNALRFEEIQQFNVTLQRKIDEATRNLRRANEKLKAMDETKDEFISMASHQLRTPLTSVKGYVSMVLEGDAGKLNPMQKKLLEQTFFSAQRMVYLIADLLNVSRLRTGKFLIEPKPTDLAELVSAEVTQLLPTAKARNLELTFKRPKNFPQVMLDETKTRQVIMNFIDNAIYYTHPGGHIAVELKETDEAIEFTVTDDGLGVPKAEQHRLFTKFYRANNAKKARPDGTGLGLFMAKKVVVAQGGAIIFKSQEGKGSTFGFTFAKAKLKVPSKSSAQSPSTVLAVK